MASTTPPGPTTSPSDIFRAVSDPTRRRVLDLLQEGEKTVSELLPGFSMSQPALSQHLKILREAGLVNARAEGRTRIYEIHSEPLHEVSEWAAQFRRVWGRRIERGASTFEGDF